MARGNFGELLKREREMREVSLNEVTTATRIGMRFLEALENEEWHKLPGGVFNRGFVRTIARYLGLDEENLLAEYDLARSEQKIETSALQENSIPAPPRWIPVVAVLLAVAGFFYAGRYGYRRYAARHAARHSSAGSLTSEPQPGMGTIAPLAASNISPTSSISPLDLSVSTSAATRIRILADGQLLLDIEVPAGETRHFSAHQQFEVSASDSSAVLLELNGQAMPPLGAPGASGTMVLSQKDLRQESGGTSQP